MEKSNLTFIWEGGGGSNETKNSLAQVLRRSWCVKEWMGLGEEAGALTGSGGVVKGGLGYLYP